MSDVVTALETVVEVIVDYCSLSEAGWLAGATLTHPQVTVEKCPVYGSLSEVTIQ
jgi:hypothetical protein